MGIIAPTSLTIMTVKGDEVLKGSETVLAYRPRRNHCIRWNNSRIRFRIHIYFPPACCNLRSTKSVFAKGIIIDKVSNPSPIQFVSSFYWDWSRKKKEHSLIFSYLPLNLHAFENKSLSQKFNTNNNKRSKNNLVGEKKFTQMTFELGIIIISVLFKVSLILVMNINSSLV